MVIPGGMSLKRLLHVCIISTTRRLGTCHVMMLSNAYSNVVWITELNVSIVYITVTVSKRDNTEFVPFFRFHAEQ